VPCSRPHSGDSRCCRRWTTENIEYDKIYCTWVFNTFVMITNQQYRLRFLEARESGETSSGYFWAPRGQPNRSASPGPSSKRFNIIGMTSCAHARHHLPLTYAVFQGSRAKRFAELCWDGSHSAASCRATGS
jgi:hypothetical protein